MLQICQGGHMLIPSEVKLGKVNIKRQDCKNRLQIGQGGSMSILPKGHTRRFIYFDKMDDTGNGVVK